MAASLAAVSVCVAFPVQAETVLYEFSATSRCQPCRAMAPLVERLASEGYTVKTYDVDRVIVSPKFGITALPTFIVYENNQEVDRIVGATTVERLKLKLKIGRRGGDKAKDGKHRDKTKAKANDTHPCKPAVVRIYCDLGGRSKAKGSGTLVRWAGKVVVVTARHVVADATRITVWVSTGKSYKARVLKVDASWDCAILELEGLPSSGIPTVDVEMGDAAMQSDGASLQSCGWGGDESFAVNAGRFIGYRRSTATPAGPDDWFLISGTARKGDSGGPVFNERGRLVGVLWGTNGQVVVCVQAGRLHLLLDSAVGTSIKQRSYRPSGSMAPAIDPRDYTPMQYRQPTPPKACPAGGCPPSVTPIEDLEPVPGPIFDGAGQSGGYALPGREKLSEEIKQGLAAERRARQQDTATINAKLDSILRQQQQPTPAPTGPVGPDPALQAQLAEQQRQLEAMKAAADAKAKEEADKAAAEPKTLVGKGIAHVKADVAEVKEKGFLKTIRDKMDDADGMIVVVVLVVAGFTIWMLRHGKGLHALNEKNREKLEVDAEAGGLKGKIAAGILKVHDGPVGDALDKVEARFAQYKADNDAKLAGVKATVQNALHVAGLAATAVVPGAAVPAAAINAVQAAANAVSAPGTPAAT
jgi:thiol-disulfide isomerase/thioredoxin